MILYLDTSAFLKLYLEEPESSRVHQAISEASAVCTHLIAYAEMRAGLARAVKYKRLSADDLAHQVECFEKDWETLRVLDVTEQLIRRAGTLAEKLGLRGYDSIHLAAVEHFAVAVPKEVTLRFAVFDHELTQAARALGLSVLT